MLPEFRARHARNLAERRADTGEAEEVGARMRLPKTAPSRRPTRAGRACAWACRSSASGRAPASGHQVGRAASQSRRSFAVWRLPLQNRRKSACRHGAQLRTRMPAAPGECRS